MSSEPVDFKNVLQDISLNIETDDISLPRRDMRRLMNMFESMASEIVLLRAENKELKNEISRRRRLETFPPRLSAEGLRTKIRLKEESQKRRSTRLKLTAQSH